MRFDFKKDGRKILLLTVASLLIAINLKTFVQTGGLYPAGVTGLTVLIQQIGLRFFHIQIPYTVVNVLLNAVPVYIGFRFIGKKFTLYSCLTILLTGLFTDIIPGLQLTEDLLLISVFGGIVSGFSVSICLLQDATTGGTDFLAIYFSQKKGTDSWNLILGINALIILSAGLLFGWDKALYSLIYQYVSTQVIHMLHKKFQRQTLFIVTNRANEVCEAISKVSNHGATILEGEGSYAHNARSFVYSVVSSAESGKVIRVIKETDPNAFINLMKTEQISGRFYQKPTE